MRKAQSAMEYLMTYGWAIAIVIVVVAALFAMGVFKLGVTVPCSPCFSYFSYVDHNSTHLLITSGAREIQGITTTFDGAPATVSPTSAIPGDKITISGTIKDGTKVVINYVVTESGMSKGDAATLHS